MGGRFSTAAPSLNVHVFGECNSGKTKFLDALVFGGDTTLSPTVGQYLAAYRHDRVMFDFCEFGSSRRAHWEEMLKRPTLAPPDAIYWFVNATDDPVDSKSVLSMCGYFNTVLASTKRPVPICIVFNERCAHDNTGLVECVYTLFRLRLLSAQGWPVYCTHLRYSDMREWGRRVEIMFDWTVENATR